jgi:hypothetical protein
VKEWRNLTVEKRGGNANFHALECRFAFVQSGLYIAFVEHLAM